MDFYAKRLLMVLGVLLVGYIFKLIFDMHWFKMLIISYFILIIYVLIKKWSTWKNMGLMCNELIKEKLKVKDVKDTKEDDDDGGPVVAKDKL